MKRAEHLHIHRAFLLPLLDGTATLTGGDHQDGGDDSTAGQVERFSESGIDGVLGVLFPTGEGGAVLGAVPFMHHVFHSLTAAV